MSASLARYLKDFSAPRPMVSEPVEIDFGVPLIDAAPAFPLLTETETVDVEAERQDARAQGYAAATEELTRKHAEELEALAARHQQEIADLAEVYGGQTADAVTAGLQRIAGLIATEVSEQAAAALAPILTEELTRKAIADLADMIQAAVLEGVAGTIVVRGPAELFGALKEKMGENASALHHIEAADVDLTVEIDGSVLVTRMSAWAASLKKVLE